jgi:hypothetical protein
MRGLGIQAHICYMEEHKLTKSMLEGLPCRLPGIKPSCLTRLRNDGIIARKEKNNKNVTIWKAGTYLSIIMNAWRD